ncbi:MAG: UvrD-helicase domain-containing protein [Gammaproteobacteria bacterium]|nr:UvrD-helicase domain-containing protein [Gammaproteobacteria bacterium]NPA79327.1 UvrD-helicase domain-containing protein [Gammaproteobacteria bacterium]
MKHDIHTPSINASTETNIDEASIKEDVDSLPHLPPAVTLPLTGRHLIEASAGTGKTWTLTGVMLRLIVQAGQPCEKIIATTFTRSAAAEMRQRIRERLQDFYQLLQMINHSTFTPLNDSELDSNKAIAVQKYAHFIAQVQALAAQKNLLGKYQDPINKHLIEWIAKQVFGLPVDVTAAASPKASISTPKPTADDSENSTHKPAKNTVNFRIALQRTTLALNQLDRLFVSTLDSLCQKWLREYSSETGFSAEVQISNDVSGIIKGMIHDQLRAFMAQVNANMPELYPMMFDNNVFLAVADYYEAVNRALNFYTADIDTVPLTAFDTTTIKALMQSIADDNDSGFEAYFDSDFRKAQGFSASNKLHKHFIEIKNLQNLLSTGDITNVFAMYKVGNIVKVLEGIEDLYANDKGFNSKKEQQSATFKSFDIVDKIWQLIQQTQALQDYFKQVNFYFIQFISRYVRTHLPKRLESQRLTTFALQLARLNDALSGKKGQSLARYIRHQYPIALIDESQDINTEQALLIQRVYLQDFEPDTADKAEKSNTNKYHTPSQFLLLVGDPKQAIYGFRGGDVQNYTTLKKLFPEQPKSLNQNHRSSAALINSLNHWYGVGEQDIDPNEADQLPNVNQQPYFMGREIYYRKISATRQTAELVIGNALDNEAASLPAFNHITIEYKAPYSQQVVAVAESDGISSDTNENTLSSDERTVDYADAIAAQIFDLFDDGKPLSYQTRGLTLSDICVLAVKNSELHTIEKRLHHHGIATVRGGSQSVFGDSMSVDLMTLQSVLLTPFSESKLKSLMLSSFFQLTLEQINQLYDALNQTNAQAAQGQAHTYHQASTSTSLAEIQQLVLTVSELWQKHSFLVAIQWLLNQPLTLPNQITLNFWQRLAKHPNGERLLIDLRQLLDIISDQFNGQVGEHQLFEWFCAQVQQQPKEDWSTQQRLTSDEGVQLMTVHASKGLEFPIVFVVGFTGESKAKFRGAPLYLYGIQTTHQATPQFTQKLTQNNDNPLLNRRLTALPSQIADNNPINSINYVAIEDQSAYEERLRLLYVALTRAKEQVYLVTVAKKSAVKNSALAPFMDDLAKFAIKETLTETTHIIDSNSLSKYYDSKLKFTPKTNGQNEQNTTVAKIDYDEIIKVITIDTFKGWANTSFTALSRYIDHASVDTVVNAEDRQDDDILSAAQTRLLPIANNRLSGEPSNEVNSIRFNFEKGTNPGTFLHSILEDIANNYNETPALAVPQQDARADKLKRWSVMVDRTLRRYQMPSNYFSTKASSAGQYGNWHDINIDALQPDYIALVDWLDDIIHTPLAASAVPLVNIKYNQKVAELGFNLRLNQHLSFSDLNALFHQFDIPLQLQSQEVNTMVWQYLKGEIDLVYQHGTQFFIVDYKSNYLGSDFDSYDPAALYDAMTTHSYWLQASIYQVALHRYLKLRLPNYDINTHLGAVEYAFLRGMSPKHDTRGKLVKQFDIDFILALDDMFGYPNDN